LYNKDVVENRGGREGAQGDGHGNAGLAGCH
jgi:hypothetical protein